MHPSFRPNSGVQDGAMLRKYYHELIGKKTLNEDVELMNDIINYRKEVLQHRMSAYVSLYANGTEVASMNVYTVLIEAGQPIVDFWYGRQIDPSSFNTLIEEFKTFVYQFGSKGVHTNRLPDKKYNISGVEIVFAFS